MALGSLQVGRALPTVPAPPSGDDNARNQGRQSSRELNAGSGEFNKFFGGGRHVVSKSKPTPLLMRALALSTSPPVDCADIRVMSELNQRRYAHCKAKFQLRETSGGSRSKLGESPEKLQCS